jgi:hypothetical protein
MSELDPIGVDLGEARMMLPIVKRVARRNGPQRTTCERLTPSVAQSETQLAEPRKPAATMQTV